MELTKYKIVIDCESGNEIQVPMTKEELDAIEISKATRAKEQDGETL